MSQCSCGFLSTSFPRNSLLLQSHQTEIIIVKCLFQERNNMTRLRVEPRSCDDDRRKNYAFTLSVCIHVESVCFVEAKKRFTFFVLLCKTS